MAASNFQGRHVRQPSKNTLLKVVILGDGGVGKSCLMNRFVSNHFDEHSFHTIGVEFLNKDIEINGEMYTLQIWDTAGQERFKSLRTPFYRGSDICLLTYAVDDRTSFRNLALWRNEFLYYADVKEGTTFPFLIVGNKVDVGPEQREVSLEEAKAWCLENGNPPHVETSAKDATNVEEAFSLAVESWARLEAKLERPYVGDTVDLRRQQPEQRSSCCLSIPQTENDWLGIERGFSGVWNLYHCVGTIDGKHVALQEPPYSGSHYYNYKGHTALSFWQQ